MIIKQQKNASNTEAECDKLKSITGDLMRPKAFEFTLFSKT